MKRVIVTIGILAMVGGVFMAAGCKKSNDDHMAYVIDKIADEINLDDEQEQWLTEFKTEIKNEKEKCKKVNEEKCAAIKESFINGDADEVLIDSIIEEKIILVKERIPYFVSKLSEVHKNLTMEQREKLVELVNEFHEKRKSSEKRCKFSKSEGYFKEKIIKHINGKIQNRLGLTDIQEEWLDLFVDGIVEDANKLKSKKEELHSLKEIILDGVSREFLSDSFNENKISLLITNNLPFHMVKELPIAAKIVEVQSNLTKEQRIELISLKEEMKNKKKRGCGWYKKHCMF